MHGLAETIARLNAGQNARWSQKVTSRLRTVAGVGYNPGSLTMKGYVPDELAAGSPLVVVLHGCTQSADAYDFGSGWSALADEKEFAVLYPEQQRTNNPNLCFNWFQPEDVARGSGEAASIHEMIQTMVSTYDLDPKRVFITGLSAGGAMTAAMLSAYPDVFAGGAIIAGLPAGSASTVSQALQQMRSPSQGAAAAKRGAARYAGPLPTISVWHGDLDHTVAAANADGIVQQWRELHGLKSDGLSEAIDGHRRTAWRNGDGQEIIEQYSISGMGHGVPLRTDGTDALGNPGAYMLDVGVSSTRHIANFWKLTNVRQTALTTKVERPVHGPRLSIPTPITATAPTGPAAVIESALRAAGLMR